MNMLMLLATLGVFFLLIVVAIILSAAKARGRRRGAGSTAQSDQLRPDTRESMTPGDD